MSSFVRFAIPIAVLTLIVSCTSFGADPSPRAELPDGGSGDQDRDGAEADGGSLSDRLLDGGLDDASDPGCSAGAELTDGFEGSWSSTEKWTSTVLSGSGAFATDTTRRRTDVNSLRFTTVNWSDTAVLTKALSGACSVTIRVWIYIGANSVTDGTGLLQLKLSNGGSVGVHLIEGAWIAASGQSPALGALSRQVWTELVVKYNPANGDAFVSAGNLAPRTFNVGLATPTSIELGILGASDGGLNGDEILFDDVSISRAL